MGRGRSGFSAGSPAPPFSCGGPAVFMINRQIVNTAIGRDVRDALVAYDIPVLKSAVCQRVAFAESAATGRTVLESAPNSRASQEVQALAQEILEEV